MTICRGPLLLTIVLIIAKITHFEISGIFQNFDSVHCTPPFVRPVTDDPDTENDDDNDGLSENPEEDTTIVSTSATPLTQIQPTAPITGTIWQNADYFELADALQQGLYPRSPLPFRTIVQGDTALHLTRDPTMKTISIEDAIEKFNLPDLRGALADFLTRLDNNDTFHIGGRRIGDRNSLANFSMPQFTQMALPKGHTVHPPPIS